MTRSEIAFRTVGSLGGGSLRLAGRTFRYAVQEAEGYRRLRSEGRPKVFVFWHAWILPLVYLHRNEGAVVLISRHADGEYIARVVEKMGFRTARGSSSRGGAQGLRELVRAVRGGADAAITPDGPRGPARQFKPGGLLLSRITGAPLVPVRVRAPGAWRIDSWDRFIVPKPFSRIEVAYGEPHSIPRDASEEELAAHARHLESVLNALDDKGAPPGSGDLAAPPSTTPPEPPAKSGPPDSGRGRKGNP